MSSGNKRRKIYSYLTNLIIPQGGNRVFGFGWWLLILTTFVIFLLGSGFTESIDSFSESSSTVYETSTYETSIIEEKTPDLELLSPTPATNTLSVSLEANPNSGPAPSEAEATTGIEVLRPNNPSGAFNQNITVDENTSTTTILATTTILDDTDLDGDLLTDSATTTVKVEEEEIEEEAETETEAEEEKDEEIQAKDEAEKKLVDEQEGDEQDEEQDENEQATGEIEIEKQGEVYELKLEQQKDIIEIKGLRQKPEGMEIKIGQSSDKEVSTKVATIENAPESLDEATTTITLEKDPQKEVNVILFCKDFDSETFTCLSGWEPTNLPFKDTGSSITFTPEHFSAYAGGYLTILNIQTNLIKGDIWTVNFETLGKADLTITPTQGTSYSEDLEFSGFYCGEQERTGVFKGDRVSILNYQCQEQSKIENKTLSSGEHYLRFQFGEDIEYASNQATIESATSGDWEVTSTWNPAQVPGAGDTVTIIDGHTVTITSPSQITIADLTINSGGVLTHTASSSKINLQTTGDLDLQSGGFINADAKGKPGATSSTSTGWGTGKGKASTDSKSGGGGAGYGGYGGAGADSPEGYGGEGGIAYGSGSTPSDLGSGGGTGYSENPGGAGGGIIRLDVDGTLTISGDITANGENGGGTSTTYGGGGGGSGGTIHLTADTIGGTGSLYAKGGTTGNTDYDGGGGSGGRIAYYYGTDNYSGSCSAIGGTGYDSGESGGDGTIYSSQAAFPVSSITDPQDNAVKAPLSSILGTTFQLIDIPDSVKVSITDNTDPANKLRYNGTIWTTSTEELWLDATNDDSWANWHYGESLAIWTSQHKYLIRSKAIDGANEETPSEGNDFIFWDGTYIDRNKALHAGTTTYSGNLWVSGTSTILCESSDNGTPSDYSDDYGVTIVVSGEFILDAGSKISADGQGYAGADNICTAGSGPGDGGGSTGSYCYRAGGGGAGYGGNGGEGETYTGGGGSGGLAYYGSVIQPADLGSGGGTGHSNNDGGSGGGAIKLVITNTLTVNGTISANGQNGGSGSDGGGGGGSGGSIWIQTGTLAGSSTIAANGGNGGIGSMGDGGGGAGGRMALYYTTSSGSILNNVLAAGGTGYQNGGAGTIYFKEDSAPNGDLLIDNNSNLDLGADTPLYASTTFDDVTVQNKSILLLLSTTTLNLTSLHILSAGQLKISNTFSSPSDFTSDSTSSIIINQGGTLNWPTSTLSNLLFLTNNGTFTIPTSSLSLSNVTFYQNGTIPNLTDLTVDTGAVFEFQNLNTNIDITDEVVGTGDGSNQDFNLHYHPIRPYSQLIKVAGARKKESTDSCSTNDYTINATTSAIHFCTSSIPGSEEEITASYAINPFFTLDNLTLQNGGELTHKANTSIQDYALNLQINNNLSIDASSTIDVSTKGYAGASDHCATGSGPGGGGGSSGSNCHRAGGGGAGYGGNGGEGENYSTTPGGSGGLAYGSVIQPADLGSGGGTSLSDNGGGSGGGAIKLVITNTLTVNGTISANGQNGGQSSGDYGGGGGGSGGSIWIQTGTLAGSSTIAANGGNGGTGTMRDGGGGAGGRIAIYYATSSSFTVDDLLVTGGAGYQSGEAGTKRIRQDASIPQNPTNPKQYQEDGIEEISVEGYVYSDVIVFKATSSDSDNPSALRFQAEIKPTGEDFNEGIIYQSDWLETTSSQVTTTVTITELMSITNYHWRVRVEDQAGRLSSWVSYGANPEAETDFQTGIISTQPGNWNASSTWGGYTVTSTDIVTILNGHTVTITSTSTITIDTLIVKGVLTHTPPSGETVIAKINLSATTTIVATEGSIDATAKGYAGAGGTCTAGSGPGGGGGSTGSYCYRAGGGGAGYGGNGGEGETYTGGGGSGGLAYYDSVYDSVIQPTGLGSGGGTGHPNNDGGSGSGAIKLVITNTLTVNGTISANGQNGDSGSDGGGGGGSGGSIWIQTGTLAGSSTIAANGGNGGIGSMGDGGGGAGGRIALYYTTSSGSVLNNVLAAGGSGYQNGQYGGAGTIYLKEDSAANGDLLIDNNSNLDLGADTPLYASTTFDDVTVQNKGILLLLSTTTLNLTSLHILSSSQLKISNTFSSPSDFTSDSTSSIIINQGGTLNWPTSTLSNLLFLTNNGTFTVPTSSLSLSNVTFYQNGTIPNLTDLTVDTGAVFEFWNTNTNIDITDEAVGTGDGSNQDFNLHYHPIRPYSQLIKVAGARKKESTDSCSTNDYTINATTSAIHFCTSSIPGSEEEITASYAINPFFTLDNLTLQNGGKLTHKANYDIQEYALNLQINNNLSIDASSTIDVSDKGYAGTYGPGKGDFGGGSWAAGGGGGYGGYGGDGYQAGAAGGSPYGSLIQPIDIGSGGGLSGYGEAGGGAIKLNVSGTLTINGTITADGKNGIGENEPSWGRAGGGGSGGSIYIVAGILSGNGTTSARGGDRGAHSSSEGGGGAGGRIAIYYATSSSFTVDDLLVTGGAGYQSGEAGTKRIRQDASIPQNPTNPKQYQEDGIEEISVEGYVYSDVIIFKATSSDSDNPSALRFQAEIKPTGEDFNEGIIYQGDWLETTSSQVIIAVTSTELMSIANYHWQVRVEDQAGRLSSWVSYGANPEAETDFQTGIISTQHGNWNASSTWGGYTVTSTDIVTILNGHTVTITSTSTITIDTLIVKGVLTHASTSGETIIAKINLSATTTIVATEGSINVTGQGYPGDNGPGTGEYETYSSRYYGGGGGYGGNGGYGKWYSGVEAAGGPPYGSLRQPIDLGSGGGYISYAGKGGGVIKLNISGTLTVNGSISTNGANGTYGGGESYGYFGGGGSGGSIWIVASSTIEGSGTISAIGGNGGISSSQGGGGGAGGRIAIYYATSSGSILNNVLAAGGTGYQYGGAGTIYLKESSAPNGDLLIDNNSQLGADTPFYASTTLDDLTIQNKGILLLSSTTTLNLTSLHILPAGQLKISNTFSSPSDFTSDSTSSIIINQGGNLIWPTSTLSNLGFLTNNGTFTIPTSSLSLLNVTFYQNGTIPNLTDLTVDTGAVFEFQNLSTSTKYILDNLTLQNGGELTHKANTSTQEYTLNLQINNNLGIDASSTIDVSGKGYAGDNGPGAGKYKTSSNRYYGGGGGYGGNGGYGRWYSGGDEAAGGPPYGSLGQPIDLGSGGGYIDYAGKGGGVIKLNISGTLTVNGSVSANGANGTYDKGEGWGRFGGGGSGGSIWIVASTTIEGSGTISAIGGNGGIYSSPSQGGGGGAGGRIAVYYATSSGSVLTNPSAFGGAGRQYGGAGTVYLKEDSAAKGDLLIDNNSQLGADTPQVTSSSWTVNNLTVKGKAKYIIPENTTTSAVALINCTSDSSLTNNGAFITPSADFTISNLYFYDNGITTFSNLTIGSNGTLEAQHFSSARIITDEEVGTGDGANQDFTLLYLLKPHSQLIKVSGIIQTESTDNCLTYDYDINASTSAIHFCTSSIPGNGEKVTASYIPNPRYVLDNLTLQNGGKLTHKANTSTQDYALNIEINLNLSIDASSTIDVSGRGYLRGDSSSGSGTGGGGYFDGGSDNRVGGGAGYGNSGGQGSTSTASGGQSYGNPVQPAQLGSGGGGYSSLGGDGGGAIRIKVSDTFTLAGNILADGESGAAQDCSGSSGQMGGGGSGGSILIIANTIQGSGNISAQGGNGGKCNNDYWAGGGAGGRIALYYANSSELTESNLWVTEGTGYQSGGAGTERIRPDSQNPDIPASLTQYQERETQELTLGEKSYSDGLVFKASGSDSDTTSSVRIEAEVRLVGEEFTNVPNQIGDWKDISGAPTEVNTEILGFKGLTNYHWQARIEDQAGRLSSWVSYGDNQETETDFTASINSIKSGNWQDSSTWLNNQVPGSSDDVTVFHNVVINTENLISVNNLAITGTLTSAVITKLNLETAGDLRIRETGSLNLDGKGSPGATADCTEGQGDSSGKGDKSLNNVDGGGGAGYGGYGGAGEGIQGGTQSGTYGSLESPIHLGSGGGTGKAENPGGDGGGAVKLTVGNVLVNDGIISANGTNAGQSSADYGGGGGGSGGSIWILVSDPISGKLSGTGNILADGGDGGHPTGSGNSGGGGGGGRIAIIISAWDFGEGTITVFGGTGDDGDDGTIYMTPTSEITHPDQGAMLGYLPQIEGEAWSEINPLEKVEVSLKNLTTLKYYNETDWTETEETWLLVTTTDDWLNWTYDTPGTGFWQDNTNYKIRSKATDSAAASQNPPNEKTFLFDAEIPVARITSPADGSSLQEISIIEGTAYPGEGGSPISKTEIQINDGVNYLKSDDTWATSSTWFQPDGGTLEDWTHDVLNVTFTLETTYTIKAKTTDSSSPANVSDEDTADFTYGSLPSPPPTPPTPGTPLPPPSLPICSLSLSPSLIDQGATSTLSCQTLFAESLTIDQGIGEVLTPSSSIEVSSLETLSYTGTVRGPGGSRTCLATLIVKPLISPPPEERIPVCSLSLYPSIVDEGESATLSWQTLYADFLIINQGIGEVSLPSGSQRASPLKTTSYTAEVLGPAGSNTCSATLIVRPAEITPPGPPEPGPPEPGPPEPGPPEPEPPEPGPPENIISKLGETLKQLKEKETAKQLSKKVLTPAATAVAIVTAGTLPFLAFPIFFQNFLFQLTQLLALLTGTFRRKRKPWGIVFSTFSQTPLRGVIVRIYETSTNKLRETQITDQQGRFGFLVDPADYYIKAQKPGYAFPSIKEKLTLFGKRIRVYRGEAIRVEEKEKGLINVFIPLDPDLSLISPKKVVSTKIFSSLLSFFEKASLYIFIPGFAFSTSAYLITPNFYNKIIFIIYLLLIGALIVTSLNFKKQYGTIRDSKTKLLLSSVVIRLFNSDYGQLTQERLTDQRGRYRFLVSPGTYYLIALKKGYQVFQSDLLTIKPERAVERDFELEKVI